MGDSKQLYVIFDSDFLHDLEVLGNTMEISYYYLEDVRTSISNPNVLLDFHYGVDRYNNDQPLDVYGYWDQDKKELKVHLGLGKYTYSNLVRSTSDDGDPEFFEYDYKDNSGVHEGDRLVRVIRFTYNGDPEKTAFILTSDIKHVSASSIRLEPIRCDQDKLIITIEFPDTTQANVKARKIEKDTEFLEGPGNARGFNIFRATGEENPSTRESAFKYMGSREIGILKKDLPYISDSGKLVYRKDRVRIYTSIKIFCPGLLQNIRPKTRASLNRNGGILRIYGTLEYLEYESKGTELIYIGTGSEALEGLPDYELILTEHVGGLKDPKIENKFYIRYGKYEEQTDPSVLVKARVEFWNPFEKIVETIESENIRLTQEENVISQWEVIYRSSEYTEDSIPVYMFPYTAGYQHTFTIQTTFPDLRIEDDFEIEYSNPILQTYFKLEIERIPSRTYPITDYKVTLVSLLDNVDPFLWLPIINGESKLLLTTVRLKDYDYTESFYYVQSPKSDSLELQDINNNVINEIVLEHNQDRAEVYPVASNTRTPEEIGPKNAWKILDYNHEVLSFDEESGLLNTSENLVHRLVINSSDVPQSVEDLDLGKIIIGRIKESESGNNFTDWRSLVGLYTLTIPVSKRGIIGDLSTTDSILLEEIGLYPIHVVSNGPFACWMEESDDYCFFDPRTNSLTNSNYYYSSSFNRLEGVDVYLALHNTTILDTEPYEDNKIIFSVVEREPDWENFEPTGDIGTCKVYRKAINEPRLNYVDPLDYYVFLDQNTTTSIKLRSSETPVADNLQVLGNSYNDQHQQYYNNITLVDTLKPVFSVIDNYRYHIQNINNPYPANDYYPISPCCIYNAHLYNYPDINLPFYLFRKALGPSFYRTDSISSDIIYVDSNTGVAAFAIKSRYEIDIESDISTILNYEGAFDIQRVDHTILESNDYKHQYVIKLNIRVQNTGGQRPLGDILIVSRIYNLINIISSEYVELPYLDLTQDDIDRIVPPATMKLSIIQRSVGGENQEGIDVVGNRGGTISNLGESRRFKIFSDVPIDEPNFTNIVGSGFEIIDRSVEGFTLKVSSIVDGYESITPNDSDSYISYTERKNFSFDLVIQPLGSGDDPNLTSYVESFIFKQNGISKGLVFAAPDNIPKLYLGTNSLSYIVDSRTTYLNIFLGVFNIDSRIDDGARGVMQGIRIDTQNSFVILPGDCEYQTTSWNPTVRLEFPQNLSARVIDRVFTITYADGSMTHKIVFTVKQMSGEGNIVCNDNAYFLSHGECIEHGADTNNYEDIGFFTFETDLDIRTLSLDIPENLYESYSFLNTGTPSERGGNYKTYKAQIKLKPNLSNSIIKNQIFSFLKNGERIRNVYINQGYYSLLLCKPGYTNVGVYSGGTLGDTNNLIDVPTRDNNTIGTRKLFYIVLNRQEPIPETGTYTEREEVIFPDITNLLYVSSYTWAKLGPTLINKDNSSDNRTATNSSSGTYLVEYRSEVCPDLTDSGGYPYLENKYIVNTRYYTTEIPIKVELSILANYPTSDPLFWLYRKTTEHTYTIYLLKTADPG